MARRSTAPQSRIVATALSASSVAALVTVLAVTAEEPGGSAEVSSTPATVPAVPEPAATGTGAAVTPPPVVIVRRHHVPAGATTATGTSRTTSRSAPASSRPAASSPAPATPAPTPRPAPAPDPPRSQASG